MVILIPYDHFVFFGVLGPWNCGLFSANFLQAIAFELGKW